MRIKYDIALMKYITVFEYLTQAKVKDCLLYQGGLLFIVEQNEIGKAIGRKGINVQRLEHALQKRIRVVEFNPELHSFIQNLIAPLRATEIKSQDDIVLIVGPDTKTKGLLIGRNGQNLRQYEEVAQRYFPIKEIKVI